MENNNYLGSFKVTNCSHYDNNPMWEKWEIGNGKKFKIKREDGKPFLLTLVDDNGTDKGTLGELIVPKDLHAWMSHFISIDKLVIKVEDKGKGDGMDHRLTVHLFASKPTQQKEGK